MANDKYYFRRYRARKRREKEAHAQRQVPCMVLAALLGEDSDPDAHKLKTTRYGMGPGGARRMVERTKEDIADLRERATQRARRLREWLDVDVSPDAPGTFEGPMKQGVPRAAAEPLDMDAQAAIRELLAIEECLVELGKADEHEKGGTEK